MNEENKNIYISYWLLLITFLVALMIIIGGLTRLTNSGLSITRWDLISGIIPPLNYEDWEKSFELYKEIPEYTLINSSMSLEEYKTIYWWEYVHRLLGRIIGLFYFVPLLYFTFRNPKIKSSLSSFYLIFILICFQGFVGWFMVKSGLSERTDVSHYRLSIHLTLAFIIFIFLLWSFFKIKYKNKFNTFYKLPYYLPNFFIFLILLQISIGALVSGLDAGQIYQSWPLMNQSYFPDDSNFKDLFLLSALETPSLVQFIHRNLAYLILLHFIIMMIVVLRNTNFLYLKNSILLLLSAILLQIFLGILTILSGAQIVLASLHQIGSIYLVFTSLILVFKNSKIN